MNDYSARKYTSMSLQEIRDLQRELISTKNIANLLNPEKQIKYTFQAFNYHELLITAVLAKPSLMTSMINLKHFNDYIYKKTIQKTFSNVQSSAFYLKRRPFNKERAKREPSPYLVHIKNENIDYFLPDFQRYKYARLIGIQDNHFPREIFFTLLEASVYYGAFNMFKFLRAKKCKLNRTFYLAILKNRIEIVKYLLAENKDNINILIHFIGCAVKYHRDSIIQIILENIKEDQKIAVKRRIFRQAILYMNFEYINEEYYTNIFTKDNKGCIKDSLIFKYLDNTKGIKWDFLKNYFYPGIQHYQDIASNDEYQLLDFLKKGVPNSNISINEIFSSSSIQNDSFEKLFQKAALAKDYQTIYYLATIYGNLSFVKTKKKYDCTVYETPLSCLMKSETKEGYKLFKKLLANPRIDPNITFQKITKNMYGKYQTCLTYCIQKKKLDIISLLMRNPRINIETPETVVEIVSNNGDCRTTKRTPLAIYIEKRNQRMIDFFIQKCGIRLNKNKTAKNCNRNDEYFDETLNYDELIIRCGENVELYTLA